MRLASSVISNIDGDTSNTVVPWYCHVRAKQTLCVNMGIQRLLRDDDQ